MAEQYRSTISDEERAARDFSGRCHSGNYHVGDFLRCGYADLKKTLKKVKLF